MGFRFEKELRQAVLSSAAILPLISPNQESYYIQLELSGYFGIPDIVIARIEESGQLQTFAFELKLSHWKKALTQAFRYRAFSNYSYVILDRANSAAALRNLDHFRKANIGLVSIDISYNIEIHYKAELGPPYSSQLASRFESCLDRDIRQKAQRVPPLPSLNVSSYPDENSLLKGIFVWRETTPAEFAV